MEINFNDHFEKNMEGGVEMLHEHYRGEEPNPPHEHRDLGHPIPPHEHRNLGHPISPHEKRALMHVELDEQDLALLRMVFGDEDTAEAAAEIIQDAPMEIQILAIQLIYLIEKEVA